ncbi:MAG: 50S ribosomal protein L21 [Bdellovibrionales bacterium]
MYAIIRTGGKQYKVQPGDVLRIEKLEADLGSELDLTEVLAIGGDQMILGEPNVKNAKVTVVVTNQRQGPKVIIFKKKRRQGYRRLTGHRQLYTEIFVKSISSPAGTVTAEGKAQVFDPEKKQERDLRKADFAQQVKQSTRSGEASTEEKAPKKVAKAVKKPAKKAAGKKKTAKKKTTAKKKSSK